MFTIGCLSWKEKAVLCLVEGSGRINITKRCWFWVSSIILVLIKTKCSSAVYFFRDVIVKYLSPFCNLNFLVIQDNQKNYYSFSERNLNKTNLVQKS